MPDGFGGFMTPILAAFDPDGRKTDALTGKGTPNADGGGNMPNADPPGTTSTLSAGGRTGRTPFPVRTTNGPYLPDPGGYLETDIFGNATWHSTNGQPDLHGDAALTKGAEWGVGPGTPNAD